MQYNFKRSASKSQVEQVQRKHAKYHLTTARQQNTNCYVIPTKLRIFNRKGTIILCSKR